MTEYKEIVGKITAGHSLTRNYLGNHFQLSSNEFHLVTSQTRVANSLVTLLYYKEKLSGVAQNQLQSVPYTAE
jgi:hypothetical protein